MTKSYFGWKSWLGAGESMALELLMMIREARNRKSSNNCWMRDGPETTRRLSIIKVHTRLRISNMSTCVHSHPDVPFHCRTARAVSWWVGDVQPARCYLPRWSPSQSSSWAQSCQARRSHPPAWWQRSLLTPPSLTLDHTRPEMRDNQNLIL